jgi:shikimate kinase
MASGKTVVGALVAERTNSVFHDLDLMVEWEAGMPISEIFASKGEPAFRALEARLLPRALEDGAVVALGGGTVIDDANWRVVVDRACSIYLEVPFEVMWERVRTVGGRPLIAGRSMEDVRALFEKRRTRYEEAERRIDANRSPSVVADEVIKIWSA